MVSGEDDRGRLTNCRIVYMEAVVRGVSCIWLVIVLHGEVQLLDL